MSDLIDAQKLVFSGVSCEALFAVLWALGGWLFYAFDASGGGCCVESSVLLRTCKTC